MGFGGTYLTEETAETSNLKVTHHVVDRPLTKLDSTREYVQPQWIVDSLNNLFLLPTQPYRPGVAPPPHLSPFTDPSKEGYIPTRQKEINQLKGIVDDEVISEEEQEEEPVEVVPKQVAASKEVKKAPAKGDADSSSEEEGKDVKTKTQ